MAHQSRIEIGFFASLMCEQSLWQKELLLRLLVVGERLHGNEFHSKSWYSIHARLA
jgi:hypothetical protein